MNSEKITTKLITHTTPIIISYLLLTYIILTQSQTLFDPLNKILNTTDWLTLSIYICLPATAFAFISHIVFQIKIKEKMLSKQRLNNKYSYAERTTQTTIIKASAILIICLLITNPTTLYFCDQHIIEKAASLAVITLTTPIMAFSCIIYANKLLLKQIQAEAHKKLNINVTMEELNQKTPFNQITNALMHHKQ